MKKYSVLTDEAGNIIGVICYTTKDQLQDLTLQAINTFFGDIPKNFTGDMDIEEAFVVAFENEPSKEFYLTPSTLYYTK